MILFAEEMQGQDYHAEDGRDPGREGRAENAELHGEDKNIVEHNIKEAAAKHAEHREAGIAVVTHKRDEQVVEDKRTGKYHQQLEVG